jgi:membrane protease YdiL (CAAX protease family)
MWVVWHLPYLFTVGTYRGFPPAGYAGFAFGIACGSIVLTWLYNGTGGSILACAVWHGAYNLGTTDDLRPCAGRASLASGRVPHGRMVPRVKRSSNRSAACSWAHLSAGDRLHIGVSALFVEAFPKGRGLAAAVE